MIRFGSDDGRATLLWVRFREEGHEAVRRRRRRAQVVIVIVMVNGEGRNLLAIKKGKNATRRHTFNPVTS
jgi:hypothetical protein